MTKSDFRSEESISIIIQFFKVKNNNLGTHFLIVTSILDTLYFLESCPIFGYLSLIVHNSHSQHSQ